MSFPLGFSGMKQLERVVEEGNYIDRISVRRKKKKSTNQTVLTGELWLGPAQRSVEECACDLLPTKSLSLYLTISMSISLLKVKHVLKYSSGGKPWLARLKETKIT